MVGSDEGSLAKVLKVLITLTFLQDKAAVNKDQ